MNDDATINENGGKYAGMDRYEARKAIVAESGGAGPAGKDRSASRHNVGTHDRCNTTVEPHDQTAVVRKDGRDGKAGHRSDQRTADLNFVPERLDKTYLHWLENIRDWCISRQLWWGHQHSGLLL